MINKILIFLVLFAINFLSYGTDLSHMVINGDDVYILSEAPDFLRNPQSHLTNFSGQYRPLTRTFFNLYLPFKTNHTFIYLLHLFWFTFVEFLLFAIARNKLSFLPSLLIILFVFLNPIFYYHALTLAGDINLVVVALLLIDILLFQHKKYWLTLPVLLISIFCKETFVVLLPVTILSVLQIKTKKQIKYVLIASVVLLALSYLLVRFGSYKSLDDNYRFIFSFDKAKENLLNFIAWIMGHPRGADFSFYGFRNVWNYLNTFTLVYLFLMTAKLAVKLPRDYLLMLLFSMLFGIAPFLFINRSLLFYVDLPLIILALFMIETVVRIKHHFIFLILIAMSITISYLTFYHKWVNYSFVGASNSIAKNFINSLKRVNLSSTDNLCIVNQGMGKWPTGDGKLVYFYFSNYSGNLQTTGKDSAEDCPSGVIIRNDGGEYSPEGQHDE